jgi:hypothetical protein
MRAFRIALSGALWLLALVLCAFVFTAEHAKAQTSAPAAPSCLPSSEGGTGTEAFTGWSLNGRWTWYWCPHADGRQRLTVMLGTPELALRSLGDRLDTIRASTNKLSAAQGSWRRHVTLSIDAPELAAVRADFVAHFLATPNGGR